MKYIRIRSDSTCNISILFISKFELNIQKKMICFLTKCSFGQNNFNLALMSPRHFVDLHL